MVYVQETEIQGNQAQNRKGEALNIKAVSPNTNRVLPADYGFGANQAKLLFELPFPSININLSMVKKKRAISSSLDHPAGRNKDFSKNGVSKRVSSFYHHIKGWKIEVPGNWNRIPAFLAERTLKE